MSGGRGPVRLGVAQQDEEVRSMFITTANLPTIRPRVSQCDWWLSSTLGSTATGNSRRRSTLGLRARRRDHSIHRPGSRRRSIRRRRRFGRRVRRGLVSIVINPFALPSIIAILYGMQGRRIADEMERAGLVKNGRRRVTSGVITGIVGAVLFVLWVVLYINRG